ncbi:MAG: T9SS type A sorting domain-containing protein [Crocinitomicaceae bacterium]|nr:T9SS type A sorting domain-containing protein [Crocinitomicaceae bacterium]
MNPFKLTLLGFLFVVSSGFSQFTVLPSYSTDSCTGVIIFNLSQYTTLEWYDSDNVLLATNQDMLSNACPGNYRLERLYSGNWYTYNIEVKDRDSCRRNGPRFNGYPTTSSLTSCSGQIQVVDYYLGSLWPTSYLWNTGDTTNTINSLCIGDYWVKVTDGLGCVDTLRHRLLGQCPGVSAEFTEYTIPTGYYNNDGEFKHVIQGMTPPYNYTVNQFNLYTWGQEDSSWTIQGSYDDTLIFQNMDAAYYQIIIGDSNWCVGGGMDILELGDTLIYNGCPNFQVYANSTNETSAGVCDGTIDAFSSGADGTVNYVVFDFWGDTVATTAFVDSLCPGQYTVYGEDQGGCFWNYTVFVGDSNSIKIDYFVVNEASDINTCDAEYNFTITGGEAPYTIYHPSSGDSAVYSQSGMCSGIHRVDAWDLSWSYQGLNYLVVPISQLFNGMSNGAPLDTLHAIPVERCDVDYNDILNAYILNYSIVDSVITTNWVINYNSGGNTLISQEYIGIIDTSQVYAFTLSIYCSQLKAISNRFKAYSDLSGTILAIFENEMSDIKVYPNPTNEKFTIFSQKEGVYQLFQANGAMISQGKLGIGEQVISTEAKGVLLLRMITNKGVVTKRIVVE